MHIYHYTTAYYASTYDYYDYYDYYDKYDNYASTYDL